MFSTIVDLFTAGSDSTAMTITWAILYMLNNPHIQTELQEEIDEVFI